MSDRVASDDRLPTLVGLAAALGGVVLVEAAVGLRLGGDGVVPLVVRDVLVKWALAAAVVGVVLRWERRPLASFGATGMGWRDVASAVAVFLLGAVSYPFTTPLVESLGLETATTGIARLADLPLPLVVGLALTAAVTEEVLYRGYPIERVAELTGSLPVGAAVTLGCFLLFHVPFWEWAGRSRSGSTRSCSRCCTSGGATSGPASSRT